MFRPRSVVAALLVLAALLATGCGSSSKSSSSSNKTSTTGAAAIPEPPGGKKVASGAPVKVGFINTEGTQGIDNVAIRHTAEAGVKYVNEYLGGIAGRPLELIVCKEQNSPESGRQCANDVIRQGAVAIVMGSTGTSESSANVAVASKIPYLSDSASTAPELLTDGAYAPDGGPISLFGGMVDYAASKKYDKVALIGVDVPSVRQVVDGLAKGFFQKKNITLNPIYASQTAPDLTPAVTQATQGGNKAVIIIGNAPFCGATMKAIAAVGATNLDRVVIGPCVERDAIKASPPEVLKGSHLITWFAPDSDDSEAKLYRAVLAKYAPGVDGGGLNAQGFANVVSFARALAKVTGDVTPATIKAALDSATDIPLPVGGGNTFTCGAKLSTLFKSVCSGAYIVDEIKADGSLSFAGKGDASYVMKS